MKVKIGIIGHRKEHLESLVKALNSAVPENCECIALNVELAGEAGVLPKRIVLIPAGAIIEGRDGRCWKNDNPQKIIDYLAAANRDLVLDFEHSTEIKAPAGEQAPAAAWLSDFALDENGAVTAAVNSWTPEGEKLVSEKSYRYISPVILYEKDTMQIVGISSVGLTNRPNLFVPALNHQQKENIMDLKALLKLLGLSEDATQEAAMNAIQKLQGDLKTAMNRESTPDLQKFVPRADYDQVLERASNSEKKLADAAKEQLEESINSEVDAALKAGKIAPASKDFYTAMCRTDDGLTQFKKFLESAPVIADPSNLDGKDLPEGKALNAEQKQIAAMFGNSEDDLKKYGA
ncbi:phage protease [uncultured Desulfuromusa sp.]|uniref:phage protease n=1 Tax=uncultured Desulfuromusa sp. TaxID=219183 RepID=UPI002AA66693|nr:phage protease [uncultured Desulfuromusa sp.]